ncbi:SDR family NAD(P)-dependent oxidoreductase [Fulvivirgaceae bacterium PWU4]|uniref:SDR family NAD(P)-dependent oxidoreductase n=1 Tax=Chryseosolibacter histidini TaxID=2782349 RepID=A0AAP2DS88_9BACT|nr:SDR family NAD(P)-dependent oxidoreductase [Chryseosolibacter histidini]MBT1699494.1 SDR family NAD(P)-dependent oxidoreductase [Chryseosolibacter histidini]
MENKVALVTGAAQGIGFAAAKAFAEAGASVALADWDKELVNKAAGQLKADGHKVLAIACDVSNDSQVQEMVSKTVEAFGKLDAAFNNAGIQNVLADAADQTAEDFDRVMGVNLRGVWSCMKFELPADAQAGQWCDCKLFFDRRNSGRPAKRNIPWSEARRHRTFEKCSARICSARNSHQLHLSWHHSYADG